MYSSRSSSDGEWLIWIILFILILGVFDGDEDQRGTTPERPESTVVQCEESTLPEPDLPETGKEESPDANDVSDPSVEPGED